MNIDRVNNTSFNGGFQITKVPPQLKEELNTFQKRGCRIFENLAKEGDLFVIAHNRLDKEIKHSLKYAHKKSFKYFPNFIPPVYNSKKLTNKILEITELIPFKNKTVSRDDLPILQDAKIMLASCGYNVDFDNSLITMKQGAIRINDLTNECKTIISPKIDGKHYVKSMPYSSVEDIDYSIIDDVGFRDSERINCANTPDDIFDFNLKFKSALRNYDPNFSKENLFTRTNLELLAEFSSGTEMAEKFFEHATKDVPELTQRLCGDELFVPTREAYSLITNATSDNQNEMFNKYIEFIKCKNRLDF